MLLSGHTGIQSDTVLDVLLQGIQADTVLDGREFTVRIYPRNSRTLDVDGIFLSTEHACAAARPSLLREI